MIRVRPVRLIRNLPLIPILVAVLIVVALIGVWAKFIHKHPSIIPSTSPPAAQAQSSTSGKTSAPASSSPAASSNSTNSSAAVGTSGPAPLTPFGQFVSNHHPSASTSFKESSVCDTTPGADCYIQFSQSGQTIKLASQKTDSNGGAYWYWDVNSSGLSSGSWTITAVATLNGQTKTANDAQQLVVP